MQQKIVVFGPGPKFKGGISNFTTSLVRALHLNGADVTLISWIRQYPFFIPRNFLDTKSTENPLDKTDIEIFYLTDYNNPKTWITTIKKIVEINPHKIIFQWAISIQGLPLGYIAEKIKKKLPDCQIIFDVHNLIQKESGYLDKYLTRYALKKADTYILHGQLTLDEFRKLLPDIKLIFPKSPEYNLGDTGKTTILLYHPIYDMFKPQEGFDRESERKKLGLGKHVFLFFGFIRKYKGLHNAIQAFAMIAKKYPDASLLIVGESFWNLEEKKSFGIKIKSLIFDLAKTILVKKKDQEKNYNPLELIKTLEIENQTLVVNRFIPNEEVYKWFQLSDAVVNFYEYATPSGIESLAYNFHKPVLATRVGHFAISIHDGVNGYLAEPNNINSMAAVMEKMINHPVPENSVRQYAENLSWAKYAEEVMSINNP